MVNFENDQTYLPITMQQFQDLTNELLVEMNKLNAPHFFDADYMAQVLMGAIHAYDHKIGFVSKSALFDSCVNRISCHITYTAVQAIQAKIKNSKPSLVEPGEPATDEPPATA